MIRFNDILQQLRKEQVQFDEAILQKAYDFSVRAHEGQKNRDGKDYLQHPLEVVSILTRLKVDETTLVVGLLHDVLEEEAVSPQDVSNSFGDEVLSLIEIGNKISSIPYKKSNQQQVESFRKMFIAMARDMRVLLVYLADRLSDMRTLQFCEQQKQVEYARETLEIYAPLANRLGISWLKSELEDLSLRFLEPEKFADLASKISAQKEERAEYVEKVKKLILDLLQENALTGDVTGRFKHFYSVYKKMERTGVDLDEIYDLTAFRVLVDSVRECYEVLGLIHATWKPITGRFKDYIAMPKANMYQSLHTTVIGPFGERMEVQIRTNEMHRIAEEGVAAHWKYKEGGAVAATGRDDQRFSWLRQLLEWQQDVSTSRELAESAAIDLFPEEVYAFTPNGDVKELPQGSSPVDFAYAIHTDVGSQCVGARINGKLCPLRTVLKNGDIVEVITAKNHTPSKDWLSFVKTSKARNKIRQWVKAEQREKSIVMGRELVEKELRKHDYSMKRAQSLDSFDLAVTELGFKQVDDLYASIGYGKLSPGQFVSHVLPRDEMKITGKPGTIGKVLGKLGRKKPSSAVKIDGIDDVMVRFANCCNPLPGEPVTGFITRGRGLTVHTIDCPQVQASDPDRRIDVEWDMQRKTTRPVKIRVSCHDQKGMLVGISGAITDADANIVSASVFSRGDKKGSNLFEIDVQNLEHLNRVIREVKKVKGVYKVERLRN
ncbi:GTP pyrophosphokinase [Malonomonas rubra DSM 5091]|uniref:GTP pyrophosphokinase n=1 Tax=Malonomonas rubra DSM 5091 TaxID=1122189 RepID=A0A1M6DP25_MALRU|nr:bifunctional (p)ppGpp synthetase/guanosine-3',5'-bis(diphosphate) 3'-pyrophosphohydrolase [Malonomonas rubra]SHI74879.1 GTP pyrophosphokinase [Malonomonas rubra DSM 5091]